MKQENVDLTISYPPILFFSEKGRLWIIAAMSLGEINMFLKMLWSGYAVGTLVSILLPHYKLFCFKPVLFIRIHQDKY